MVSKRDETIMLVSGGLVGLVGYFLGSSPPALFEAAGTGTKLIMAFLLGVGLTVSFYGADKLFR